MSARPATLDTSAPVLLERGRCRVCGCTDLQACDLGAGFMCWWVDEYHTLCSAPRCLAVVPLAELERTAGLVSTNG